MDCEYQIKNVHIARTMQMINMFQTICNRISTIN